MTDRCPDLYMIAEILSPGPGFTGGKVSSSTRTIPNAFKSSQMTALDNCSMLSSQTDRVDHITCVVVVLGTTVDISLTLSMFRNFEKRDEVRALRVTENSRVSHRKLFRLYTLNCQPLWNQNFLSKYLSWVFVPSGSNNQDIVVSGVYPKKANNPNRVPYTPMY